MIFYNLYKLQTRLFFYLLLNTVEIFVVFEQVH